MTFSNFVKNSGFKVLAMAKLTPCEYSVMLYLLNCAVSGLDQFVTNEKELASLVGYEESTLAKAIDKLGENWMILVRYGEHSGAPEKGSLRIGVNFDLSKWHLESGEDQNAHDAIVFPFRRRGESSLQLVEDREQRTKTMSLSETPTWQRVMNSFIQGRSLDETELAATESDAKMLVATHPTDQVLLMIRHFDLRIPTLSLLASSWQHYQELFENETQKVDLLGARQKHMELDQRLRESVEKLLESMSDLELNDEEVGVLRILASHRHPRRQLFWAYQVRSRYPHLTSFFADHASMMLPVTSSGVVIKKKPHQD